MNDMYELHCDDMKNLRKYVKPYSVDCLITDPPYSVIGNKFDWDNIDDLYNFTKDWFGRVEEVMKENSSMYVFWSQKFLDVGLDIFKPKRVLVWHHPNLAKPTNSMYLYTYDVVFYIVRGKPKFHANFSKRTNVDVFSYPKPQSNWKGDNHRYHPASKPVELIKNFIINSTDEGDLVLDPFMGSGTTGVVSVRMKRRFIGIEKEWDYFRIAYYRIKSEVIRNEEGL